jgi:voltage-gated potassium channel
LDAFARGIREARLVLRSVWINLALFAALLVIAALVMPACGCYPGLTFGERVVNAFYMTRIESVPETGHHPLRTLLVFVMPALTVIILGEGVLRVGSAYLNRKHNREQWEELMVSRLRGHTVLCGAGELGRALLTELLARDPKAEIVLVDTHPGIVQELGLRADNLRNITGDMTSHETLEAAGVATAATVIITSGDDAHNLEAAFKAMRLNPKARVWIRLYRAGLAEMMDQTSLPNLNFFSPYKRAAVAMMEEMGIGVN